MKRLLVLLVACGGDPAASDAGVDAGAEPAPDAPQCFGAIEAYCFAAPPDGTVLISRAIDAATDPRCDPAFDDRCVIAARDIVVSGYVGVTGRPLALVAARSLQVDGLLTANGASTGADCPQPSKVPAGAGGAGGSFIGAGGDGGNGGGLATPTTAPITIRGGCAGSGATAGAGGGAIALVAGERIAILDTSVVAACGTGGGGGGAAATPGVAGSGGGSGGILLLDAPTLQIVGSVLAIGGGGGGGSNDSVNGSNGGSACGAVGASVAAGGLGNGGGGAGGTTGAGGSGATGSNGGGGGGGVGAIWVHGTLSSMTTIVPSPMAR